MRKNILFATFGLLALIMVTSCHKDNPISNVTIQNYTNTDIYGTLNGVSITIPYGGSRTYSARAGSIINGQLSGTGGTLSAPIGISLSWDLSTYYFPASGTEVIPIDVPESYFYLTIKNISPVAVKQVEVNSGLNGQTTDYVSVPNDGYVYGIGYYPAYSNSNLYITMTDNSYFSWSSLNLPFTADQVFAALLQ